MAAPLRSLSSIFVVLAIVLASVSTARAQGDDGPLETDDEGLMGIASEVSIEAFIEHAAEQTRSIFIYDRDIIGPMRVYLLGRNVRVPEAAYYNLLLALLQHMQYGLTYFGENTDDNVRIYKIEPMANIGRGKIHPMPAPSPGETRKEYFDRKLVERAEFKTLIVHLEYADPLSVQRALLNLTTRNTGVVQPITGVNAILISDFEYQIKRMAVLLDILDQPPPRVEVAVIRPRFAEAPDLVATIGDLLTARQVLRGGRAVVDEVILRAHEATNSIIVQALPERIDDVRKLVSQLDLEVPEALRGRVHTYFAKHMRAEDLATTLNDLISGEVFRPNRPLPGDPRFVPPGQEVEEEPQVVVFNEDTNALIISATADVYLEIKKIIDQIDIRRPQVMIEAAIVELSTSDSLDFGIELAGVDPPNGNSTRPFAGTSFGFSELVDEDGLPADLGAPVGRSPIAGSGIVAGIMRNTAFNIPILLKAIATTSRVNIISRPLILTEANVEASISISETVSFPTSTSDQGVVATGFGTAEAPITLTVTPYVFENEVRMVLDLSVEAFTGASGSDGSPPPTSQRRVTGELTVANGEMVVIGGLTSARTTEQVTKVPLLGDIPLLGALFRSTSIQQSRATMYIFIRPTILSAPDYSDIRRVARNALDFVRDNLIESPARDEFLRAAQGDTQRFGLEDEGRPMRRSNLFADDSTDD